MKWFDGLSSAVKRLALEYRSAEYMTTSQYSFEERLQFPNF